MTTQEITNALQELINLYGEMEKEYGICLTRQISHAQTVIEDIPEAIKKAEESIPYKVWEVTYVYTDYLDDEEPEAHYYNVVARTYESALARAKKLFTPIEVLDVRYIKESEVQLEKKRR